MPVFNPKAYTSLVSSVFLLLLLGACAAPAPREEASAETPAAQTPEPRSLYCDSFMIYDMCAQDVDGDREVDFLYFDDTKEIFMITEQYQDQTFPGLIRHKCLQILNDGIRNTSTTILNLPDDASRLRRSQLKSRLLAGYAYYLPTINKCMGEEELDDDFGESDFY